MKLFVLLTLMIVSCSLKDANQIDTIDDAAKNFLGKKLDDIKKMDIVYMGTHIQLRDSTFFEDDVSWNGLVYKHNSKVYLLIESNWKNKGKATRLTILDPILKKDEVGVGSSYGQLQSKIRFDSWKDFPDGIVAFKDKERSDISYFMEDRVDLQNQALDSIAFPLDLKVRMISIIE